MGPMTISEKFNRIKKACVQLKSCEVQLIHEPEPRVVQPVGVCLTTQRGLVVVCRQTHGYHKNASLPTTCNFSLDDCKEIRLLEKRFTVHPGFVHDPDYCTDWLVHVLPAVSN